jgi:hypothetical protein
MSPSPPNLHETSVGFAWADRPVAMVDTGKTQQRHDDRLPGKKVWFGSEVNYTGARHSTAKSVGLLSRDFLSFAGRKTGEASRSLPVECRPLRSIKNPLDS